MEIVSSSFFWECAEYAGELLVIAGCVGEYFAEFREIPRDASVRKRFERRCLKILIAGLAIGLIGLFKTTQISSLETARLNARTAKSEERAAAADLARVKLEKQLSVTSKSVVQIDPLNQP